MKRITALVLLILLVGCASTQSSHEAGELQPDKVLARIDDLGSRPSWLREAEPFRIENGMVISLGSTTIPGDGRVEAGMRIAANNAKAEISSAIEQKLEFIFQNGEEGVGLDSTQARFIGSEVSSLVVSSIRSWKRYWEKVAMISDSGERVIRYRLFVIQTMPEQDFKKAVIDALRRTQVKSGLSTDFAKKVEAQWDRLVSAPVMPQSNLNRDTASKL